MKIRFSIIFLAVVLSSYSQKHNTENIILVNVDGLRWQEIFKGADSTILSNDKFRNQDIKRLKEKYWAATADKRRQKTMPFFWNTVADQGQLYGNRELGNKVNVKNKYWFSYPGRSETFCGYYDPKVNSNEYPNNPNENVLEFINAQKGYKGKVVTFASWEAVGRILNRDRNGMLVNLPGEEVQGANLTDAQKITNEMQHYLPNYFGKDIRFDEQTFGIAKAYLLANHPKVIYLDLGDTDEFGHAGQYDSYMDAVHYIDAMLASLWKTIQNDPFYKDKTALLVFPDHGRGLGDKWTDHGTSAPHSNETWFVAMGPGIAHLGEVKTDTQIYQDEIAQTIAKLLGFTFTANHPVGAPIKSIVK